MALPNTVKLQSLKENHALLSVPNSRPLPSCPVESEKQANISRKSPILSDVIKSVPFSRFTLLVRVGLLAVLRDLVACIDPTLFMSIDNPVENVVDVMMEYNPLLRSR